MVERFDRSQIARVPLTELAPGLRALIGKMTIDDLASFLGGKSEAPPAEGSASPAPSTTTPSTRDIDGIARAILGLQGLKHRLREVERAVVAHALLTTHGNVSAAARLLGIERKALERRIARHKLR